MWQCSVRQGIESDLSSRQCALVSRAIFSEPEFHSSMEVISSVKGNLGLAWEISILSLRKIHTLNYLAIRKLSHQGTISIKIVKSSFLFS